VTLGVLAVGAKLLILRRRYLLILARSRVFLAFGRGWVISGMGPSEGDMTGILTPTEITF
jgi:hypothetical protein